MKLPSRQWIDQTPTALGVVLSLALFAHWLSLPMASPSNKAIMAFSPDFS